MKKKKQKNMPITPANWGTIISHYLFFAILYAWWHYFYPLRHCYISYCFANVQTIIVHYYIISKVTIISLMTLLLLHLFFCNNYCYFNSVIAIIIPLICFLAYYYNYDHPDIIIFIIVLSDYYNNYIFILILYALILYQNNISIIAIMTIK